MSNEKQRMVTVAYFCCLTLGVHGSKPWVREPSLTPCPLCRRGDRERGVRQPTDGVRAIHPRAYALGYNLPPLTGLPEGRPHEEDFVNERM